MAFQDQTLTCKECGNTFTFTASEQDFYQQKGFTNAPVRCPDCRKRKREERNGQRGERVMHEITCAQCGAKDTVPFVPRGDKPVLCKNCFRKNQ